MKFITVHDLHQKHQLGETLHLIDVRSPEEYVLGHVPFAKLIPLDDLINQPNVALEVLPKMAMHETLYVICLSDRRSYMAAKILTEIGMPNSVYVKGGTQAWKQEGYPLSCAHPL